MTGFYVALAYLLLLASVGGWGLLAIAVHVGLQLLAVRAAGGIRRRR